MLHHTTIPWSPERMRRLNLALIRSSGKAANVPKPTSVGITSSQIRIALASRGFLSLRGGPNFLVLVVHRVVPAKLAIRKSDGFVLIGKRSHRLAARAHDPSCS